MVSHHLGFVTEPFIILAVNYLSAIPPGASLGSPRERSWAPVRGAFPATVASEAYGVVLRQGAYEIPYMQSIWRHTCMPRKDYATYHPPIDAA